MHLWMKRIGLSQPIVFRLWQKKKSTIKQANVSKIKRSENINVITLNSFEQKFCPMVKLLYFDKIGLLSLLLYTYSAQLEIV